MLIPSCVRREKTVFFPPLLRNTRFDSNLQRHISKSRQEGKERYTYYKIPYRKEGKGGGVQKCSLSKGGGGKEAIQVFLL